ncbi:MAG TPA: hypothetical protein PKI59_00100 [Candidatus Cloacimonadota bacterium]|nr:hypothetical protein [Candidatus Cloacimonadota bacterium]
MEDNFTYPHTEETLFLLLGLLAEKEGIIKKDSTWINFVWGRIAQIEDQISEVAARGEQLLKEETAK